MSPMEQATGGGGARWYRSFYWRIGLSFVVLVVVVLIAQSAMFHFLMARQNHALPGHSPNSVAAIVAADLGSALTQDPTLDVQQYFHTEYEQTAMMVVVIMKDGREVSNTPQTVQGDL